MTAFETILLDVDAATRVATITLNRPDALNSFNRTMCEEMAGAWRIVKLDESVNAVVLRAAGDRAFSAGLDITTPYGQPDNVWNHEDPGEALSPKWQKMWKPVVCAVQGLCTAGAFYFVNEADVVICSTDATFFDSHVSAGLVCALEPIGLMRRIGLGETLRIALMGNDERVSADTALRIGLVSEVVPRDRLWARAHEIASAIAAKPPSATQGTVKAIWESLDKPYRAAMEQNLIYTRLGNPLGRAELAARGGAELAARGGAELAARGGAELAARGGAELAARGGAELAARGEGGAAEPRIR
jgi:enoyl-CoA hydratase/carnithine racemase